MLNKIEANNGSTKTERIDIKSSFNCNPPSHISDAGVKETVPYINETIANMAQNIT